MFGVQGLEVGVRGLELESSGFEVWVFGCLNVWYSRFGGLEFKVWKFGGCKSLIARSTSDGSADFRCFSAVVANQGYCNA